MKRKGEAVETQGRFTQGCIVEVTRWVKVPTWAQQELKGAGVEVKLTDFVTLGRGDRGLLIDTHEGSRSHGADVLIQGQVVAINKNALKVVS